MDFECYLVKLKEIFYLDQWITIDQGLDFQRKKKRHKKLNIHIWNSISASNSSRRTTFTHLERDFQMKRKWKPYLQKVEDSEAWMEKLSEVEGKPTSEVVQIWGWRRRWREGRRSLGNRKVAPNSKINKIPNVNQPKIRKNEELNDASRSIEP